MFIINQSDLAAVIPSDVCLKHPSSSPSLSTTWMCWTVSIATLTFMVWGHTNKISDGSPSFQLHFNTVMGVWYCKSLTQNGSGSLLAKWWASLQLDLGNGTVNFYQSCFFATSARVRKWQNIHDHFSCQITKRFLFICCEDDSWLNMVLKREK